MCRENWDSQGVPLQMDPVCSVPKTRTAGLPLASDPPAPAVYPCKRLLSKSLSKRLITCGLSWVALKSESRMVLVYGGIDLHGGHRPSSAGQGTGPGRSRGGRWEPRCQCSTALSTLRAWVFHCSQSVLSTRTLTQVNRLVLFFHFLVKSSGQQTKPRLGEAGSEPMS